jgi:hypothetical protein
MDKCKREAYRLPYYDQVVEVSQLRLPPLLQGRKVLASR